MAWELKITKVNNGYVVSSSGSDDVGVDELNGVYEEKRSDAWNKDHFISALYDIINYFGEDSGRHSKRRLTLGYKKGDKYVGEENIQIGVDYPVLYDKGEI